MEELKNYEIETIREFLVEFFALVNKKTNGQIQISGIISDWDKDDPCHYNFSSQNFAVHKHLFTALISMFYKVTDNKELDEWLIKGADLIRTIEYPRSENAIINKI